MPHSSIRNVCVYVIRVSAVLCVLHSPFPPKKYHSKTKTWILFAFVIESTAVSCTHIKNPISQFFFFMFFHSFPLTYFFRLYTSLRLSNMYRTMPRVIRGILLTNVAVEKIDLLQRELSAFSSISFWGSYSTFGDSFRSITVSSALLLSSGVLCVWCVVCGLHSHSFPY